MLHFLLISSDTTVGLQNRPQDLIPRLRQTGQGLIHAEDYYIRCRRAGTDATDALELNDKLCLSLAE